MFSLQVKLFFRIVTSAKKFHITEIYLLTLIIFGLAVLGWQNTCETVENIAATLAALNTEIDISIMYRGLGPKSTYNLVSVVRISSSSLLPEDWFPT